MNHDEKRRLLQANDEGKAWGMRIGAGAMRELVLALPGIPQELAAKVRAIDIDKIKVKK